MKGGETMCVSRGPVMSSTNPAFILVLFILLVLIVCGVCTF